MNYQATVKEPNFISHGILLEKLITRLGLKCTFVERQSREIKLNPLFSSVKKKGPRYASTYSFLSVST